jgi:hypothetical protein
VIGEKLQGEHCLRVEVPSPSIPKEGWALFQRMAAGRLDPRAREFLVGLFEDGRKDRNLRCSPVTAELKLRDEFPDEELCWLSVKQVDIRFYLFHVKL